jgi:hypothetical protein
MFHYFFHHFTYGPAVSPFHSALIYSHFPFTLMLTCHLVIHWSYVLSVFVSSTHFYISIGQPHEGSGYASQKVLQMAWHRLEHARSRVNELERIKNKHLQGRALLRPQPQQMNQNQQNGLQAVGSAQGAGTTG